MELRDVKQLPELDISYNVIYLLNKNQEHRNDLESFVYASVQNEVSSDSYIGFEYINKSEYMSFENKISKRLVCITHLKDSEHPLYISNINNHKYVYKKFNSEDELHVHLPVKNTQLLFKSEIGIISNNLTEMLAIYIYDHKPSNLQTYSSNIGYTDTCYALERLTMNIDKVHLKGILNFNLFNKLIYERKKELGELNGITNELKRRVDKSNKTIMLIEMRSHNNIAIFDIHLDDMINNKKQTNNRFINRYKSNNLIDNLMCDYVNDLVLQSNTSLNTQNLLADQHMRKIVEFIINKIIMPEISKNYNIPIGYSIGMQSVNVTTLTSAGFRNSKIEPAKQKSHIIADFMFTNNSDCQGYSHMFNDNTKLCLQKGDLITYCEDSIVHETILNKGRISMLTFKLIIKKNGIMNEDITHIDTSHKDVVF
jgi:hypothetical protein